MYDFDSTIHRVESSGDVFGYDLSSESSTFEVKSAGNGLPRSMWETFSAFANTFGGRIVLGVTEGDDGKSLKVTGVPDHEKMIRDIWSCLNDVGKVSKNSLTEDDVYLRFVEGKPVIVIDVPRERRENRPVYINGNPMTGTFRRSLDGDYRCTDNEIREMFRDSGDGPGDARMVDSLGLEALNEESVVGYRNLLRSFKPSHPWLKESDEEFLRLIGAVVYDTDGCPHPTEAGLLMFGKETDIITVFHRYFLDYHEVGVGTDRWTYRLMSSAGDWSGNVFDFYMKVVQKIQTMVGAPFSLDGFVRTDDSDVLKSIREAVMNALIHADYYGSQGTVVEAGAFSITVRNPGSFRIPLEVAKRGGISDPRNPLMMRMFSFVGLVERMGTGIRCMEDADRSGQISLKVTESVDPSMVTVRILLGKGEKLSSGEMTILELMAENPEITLGDIAEKAGVSQRTVSRIVEGLKENGLVKRVGSRRSGRWLVRGSQ